MHPLAGSGSNRMYYRLYDVNGKTCILTENSFVEENLTFLYFSGALQSPNFNLPHIIGVDDSYTMYLQEDIGDVNLLQLLLEKGYTDETYTMYQDVVKRYSLLQSHLQFNKVDYSNCYDYKKFDDKVVFNDLFYFKNYFLDRLDLNYSKSAFITDIYKLVKEILSLPNDFFIYRDFQARNIMVKDDHYYLIDYQGGMQGFLGYDIVSLLYQAKAQLPRQWKIDMTENYISYTKDLTKLSYSKIWTSIQVSYILRFFQVLGAYGLRGLVERKPHFIESIQLNIKNIEFLIESDYFHRYKAFNKIAKHLVSEEVKDKINNLIQSE